MIDSVLSVLAPLEDLIDLLSGETCSAIRPLLKLTFETILCDKEQDMSLTHEMKARIREDLRGRYSETELVNFLNLCSFLNPCFKNQYSSTSDDNEVIKDMVREEMEKELISSQDNHHLFQVDPDPLPKKREIW